jgi:hypothetical protein
MKDSTGSRSYKEPFLLEYVCGILRPLFGCILKALVPSYSIVDDKLIFDQKTPLTHIIICITISHHNTSVCHG